MSDAVRQMMGHLLLGMRMLADRMEEDRVNGAWKWRDLADCISSGGSPECFGAFLTGSQAYGTPRVLDSDIDLAIYTDEATEEFLLNRSEYRSGGGSSQIYFGNLNVICLTNYIEYRAWAAETRRMVAERPVQRADAVRRLDQAVAAARMNAAMSAVCDKIGG